MYTTSLKFFEVPNGNNHVSELSNTLNIYKKVSEQHSKIFVPLGKQKCSCSKIFVPRLNGTNQSAHATLREVKSGGMFLSQQRYSTLFP